MSDTIVQFDRLTDSIMKQKIKIKELEEMCEMLAERLGAHVKSDCEHDMEPNTTMDYFRCDKCYALPKDIEALQKYEAWKKGDGK